MFASVIVTMYVPLPTAVKSSLVTPLFQLNAKGGVPPTAVRFAPPSNVLLQEASIILIVEEIELIVKCSVATESHPSALVKEEST